MKIPLKDIHISDRGRKSYGDLQGLSESIEKLGLLHPIVVEKEGDSYKLLAGERRLRACFLLGRTEIDATLRSELSSTEKREIELEENLMRQDLSWLEVTEMRAALDALKREIYGHGMKGSKASTGWTLEKSAEALDIGKGMMSQDVQLARFLKLHPELRVDFARAPKAVALRKMRSYDIEQALQRRLESGALKNSLVLTHTDALKGLSELGDSCVDLLLTDPPYGTNAVLGAEFSEKQGLMKTEDNLSETSMKELLRACVAEFFRVLKPGRHLYIFCSVEHFPFLRELLLSAGFYVSNFPLVWSKEMPMTAFTTLCYVRSYELIVFGYKTTEPAEIRPLKAHSLDVLKFKPVTSKERLHAFEKPLDLLSFLITQSTHSGELVLDPFAGSAATIVAALRLNRSALGFELDPGHHAKATERLANELKGGMATT